MSGMELSIERLCSENEVLVDRIRKYKGNLTSGDGAVVGYKVYNSSSLSFCGLVDEHSVDCWIVEGSCVKV